MKTIYKWLHMSDIHFQTKEKSFDSSQLQEELVEFLSKEINNVNALFISGDFRFAKDGECNPQKVVEYTKRCASALNLEVSSIYTMPGNHDLTRSGVRSHLAPSVRDKYVPNEGRIEQDVLKTLLNDFTFYQNYHEKLEDATKWNDNNPHTIMDLGPFSLLILNTAILACGDDDANNLVLGTNFVSSCISKAEKNKPLIAIGHHGLDMLKPEEKRAISTLFDNKNVSLYLCGHAHENWHSRFGVNGHQINVGCTWTSNHGSEASFSVGEIYEDGSVNTNSYKWDQKNQKWYEDNANRKVGFVKLDFKNTIDEGVNSVERKKDYPFSIYGYHLLGTAGEDGIKYVWEVDGKNVESVAFNRRLRIPYGEEDVSTTSAYCISTSIGCPFSREKKQCLFCATGMQNYERRLKADEIALQCIFMAEYDSDCPSYPEVRNNKREFAFMGQGEPGLQYNSVREAIILTDFALATIGQEISRYIICTSGVPDFIPSLIDDIRHGVFKNPVTVHFSLNVGGDDRDILMPMNKEYNYRDFIQECKLLYKCTQSKIGVSIMLLDNFDCGTGSKFTLTEEKLGKILDELDSNIFKIDLCFVNKVGAIKNTPMSKEKADSFLSFVHSRGFEGKEFSSFGEGAKAGCGMLDATDDEVSKVGSQPIMHYNKALELLQNAKHCRNNELERN